MACTGIGLGGAVAVVADHRQLETRINPGCRESSQLGPGCESLTNLSLIHVRSQGKKDCLHFIWSFCGAPSLLIARTALSTNLTVDWDRFLSGSNSSLDFDVVPDYVFGMSLTKVWMFIEGKDNFRLDTVNQSQVREFGSKDFNWMRQSSGEVMNETEVQLTFSANTFKGEKIGEDGCFRITVKVRNSDGYSDILPYMLHNSNISQVDVDFQNVELNYINQKTHQRIPKTHVGFEFALAQERESLEESMSLRKERSLDDEHTPGVFETFSFRTPILSEYEQAFVQWKPVGYVAKVRDISNSIDVIAYEVKTIPAENTLAAVLNSTINAYFVGKPKETLIQFANISFGEQDEGYYEKSSHISWTFMAGFGFPPNEEVSLLVKLVMAVGLGLPLIIIILSVLYVFFKKISKPKDDLLLGR
jgi:hypothetical protein